MIYREKTLKEVSFKSGDVCKECVLIDCSNLELALKIKCEIVAAPKKKIKKKVLESDFNKIEEGQ